MVLSREEEDNEYFIEEYTNQIRCMSQLTDIQIKLVIRELMVNDPEWAEVLKNRFKKKKMVRQAVKDVVKDPHGTIQHIARRVA
jgi:hypothetical protein